MKSKTKFIFSMFLSFILILLLPVAAFASSDENTDSDTESIDGYYTFTGDGDWYGYTSFLNLDFNGNTIRGRAYEVTLPEDGRLIVELSGENQVFIDVYILPEGDNTIYDDPEWQFGSATEQLSVNKETEILKAGTYDVEFWYPLSDRAGMNWPPGYHEFYHKLTFKTLSLDEKIAFEVSNMIDALPDQSKISLDQKALVEAAQKAYDTLSDDQKALIGPAADKLKNASDRIKALVEEKAKEEKGGGVNTGTDVSKPAANNEGSSTDASSMGLKEDMDPNGTVRILSESAGTAVFVKAANKKSVAVPASVSINGKTYKVVQVNANAFKGSKIRTVTIGKNVKVIKKNAFAKSKATKLILKTKLLKKAKVKGSLKGSKIKTVQVKVGSRSQNKKFVKAYKKIFTKANAGKKVTVK